LTVVDNEEVKRMSDVVLIVPNYDMKKITEGREEKPNEKEDGFQTYPSLGTLYLASSLKRNNFSVKVVDMAAERLTQEEIIRLIKKEEPLVVGIHVNSISLYCTYTLIKKIKSETGKTVVVGGPHITYEPNSVKLLGADYGLRGDSELAFPILVDCIKKDKKIGIPNLVYFKNGGLNIGNIGYTKNLDSLPFPDRSLIDAKKYRSPFENKKFTTISTSRGCPYKCIFCASNDRKGVYTRSPENVVAEIGEICNDGYGYVHFVDDFFTFDKKRISKICNLIIKKRIKISWSCNTRADSIDSNLLKLMKLSGCDYLGYGVESGDEEIRNRIIGKFVKNEVIELAFRKTRKEGIKTWGFFLFGMPTETPDTMKKTLNFAIKLNPHIVDFNLATILPNSKLYNIALTEGKISKNLWKEVITGKNPIPMYIPDGLNLDLMRDMRKKAFFKFYFRPSRITKEFFEILKRPMDLGYKLGLLSKLLRYF
jgi:anaerobic magnesium-protoporphyrin IX monomethyl ester cyclase